MAKVGKRKAGRKAEKSPKTKITVLIRKEVFDRFCDTAKELGLRRDTYLNQVLPDEIEFFRKNAPTGSEGSEILLRAIRSSQKDLAKVGITLDIDVAEAMTKACAEKHVLRDNFMESCLDYLEEALGEAVIRILNPRTHGERSTYSNLSLSDDDVARALTRIKSQKSA